MHTYIHGPFNELKRCSYYQTNLPHRCTLQGYNKQFVITILPHPEMERITTGPTLIRCYSYNGPFLAQKRHGHSSGLLMRVVSHQMK